MSSSSRYGLVPSSSSPPPHVFTVSFIKNQFGDSTPSISAKSQKFTSCEDLKNTQYLEKLDLSNNYISNISPILYSNKLEQLNLSGNKIPSIKGIENLKELKLLNISNNFVEVLDPLVKCPSLRVLIANENKISKIPLGLPLCIATIVLSGNQIESMSKLFNQRRSSEANSTKSY